MQTKTHDFAVIGAGLIGLATARALLQKYPGSSLVVLEKEPQVAAHQSGRNSGVLHSGIYYKHGSLKAQLTAAGRQAMLAFCDEHSIKYEMTGKLIVATNEEELPRLQPLYERGTENGLALEIIGPEGIAEIEPHVKAIQAIWVRQAGIVDYRHVAQALAEELVREGAEVRLNAKLQRFERKNGVLHLQTSNGEVQTRIAVNCGGLFSDRLARLTGIDPGLRIVPFRGEYFRLRAEAQHLVRGMVYPLADPRFPFLGVHLTRMTDGEVLVGPNAVFSLRREGYFSRDFELTDTLESLSYSGFWRLVLPNLGTGLGELMRSGSVRAFAREVQKMLPAIKAEHLLPARAGVRAQAVDTDGKLVEDFRFAHGDGWLHVLNAPSPGATASLAIGEYVAAQAAELVN
ncbi:MAG: L-2-hydroxyglutarate oxidase [Anaerolineales bacterium]|nr:MAG: L-2-hydroxyglutarate oxidase [Anaerolineales bacterium]